MSHSPSEVRVMVYDGHCNVCSGWAQFHYRHTMPRPFKLVAMQSVEGRELLRSNGIDPENPATFLVLDGGRRLIESDAAIHVVTELGGLWRLVGTARMVPRAWRDALYRLLARNRYRWFGKRATCYLPR